MKTYLITGGAGFIGSTLVDRLLSEGNVVINIDNFNDYYDLRLKEENIGRALLNPNYHLYRIDIVDYAALEEIFNKHKIDAIMHLAARAGVRPSIEDPFIYQNVNGLGTTNILELARKYGVKSLVLASSSSVYGNNKKVPFAETDVVDFAISPYAATKKANEVLAHVYHSLYGMSIIMLRFFTVYGPRQRPDLAINSFTKSIYLGNPIRLFGDGKTSRDYTYVDDIVDGICRSFAYIEANDSVYEIINLGSHSPISLIDMVNTIEKALNKKAIIEYAPMQPGDVEQTFANVNKAHTLLGYSPSVSFDEGIKRFVKWYLPRLEEK